MIKMPRYRSHKEVRALEIVAISDRASGEEPRFLLSFREHEPISCVSKMFFRYMPIPGDFYVVYDDGYESISPRKPFLEGYTMIPDTNPATVPSTSDDRVVNNTMRHQYRVLTDHEKAQMTAVKDAGLVFLDLLNDLKAGRETSLAKTKIEEAVMWAVKGITG